MFKCLRRWFLIIILGLETALCVMGMVLIVGPMGLLFMIGEKTTIKKAYKEAWNVYWYVIKESWISLIKYDTII